MDTDPCRAELSISGSIGGSMTSTAGVGPPRQSPGGPVSTTHTDVSPAITLTDSAAAKVAELLEQEGNPELALRVAVRPGGCSGFSYEMFFDSDLADDDVSSTFGAGPRGGRPDQRQPAAGRDPRLQGRAAGRRVQHQQSQRQPHLRLRQLVQLIRAGRTDDLVHP